MNLVNLTPHEITIYADKRAIVLPTTGVPARVATRSIPAEKVDGIPTVRTEYGAVENLPDPEDGTIYIVSTMVAQRAQRPDVLSPDTGGTAIRENGQVVAVIALQRFA